MNMTIFRYSLRFVDKTVPNKMFYGFSDCRKDKQSWTRTTNGICNVCGSSELSDEKITKAKRMFTNDVIKQMKQGTKKHWVFYLKEVIQNDQYSWMSADKTKNYFLQISDENQFLVELFEHIIVNDYNNSKGKWSSGYAAYIKAVTSSSYANEIETHFYGCQNISAPPSFFKRREVHQQFGADVIFRDEDVESIEVVALSCFYFVVDAEGRDLFKEALNSGKRFKIVILDPISEFTKRQAEDLINSSKTIARENSAHSSEGFLEIISELKDSNQLQLKYYDGTMPFSVFKVRYRKDCNNKKRDICKVVHYALETSDNDRLSFICEEGTDLFNFYTGQFNIMWNRAVFPAGVYEKTKDTNEGNV